MPHERQRNEDARGGDVLVNDSIASGEPDLPIDRDHGRQSRLGANADPSPASTPERERAKDPSTD